MQQNRERPGGMCFRVFYFDRSEEFVHLIKRLEKAGFVLKRHGGDHDIYRRENDEEQVPRHREIDERLAKAILRRWGL